MATGGGDRYQNYQGSYRGGEEFQNFQGGFGGAEQYQNFQESSRGGEQFQNFQSSTHGGGEQAERKRRLKVSSEDKDKNKMIVAAIDFGTTFSGYAFAFRSDYIQDPMRINGNQWATGSQVGVSLKTSSCVLFSPDEKFHSFGFEAEDHYSDLTMDNAHLDWFYFRRFKMMLYNNPFITRNSTLEDDKGNTMKAMAVFTEVIKYLKGHLLKTCQKRDIGVPHDEIHWVLTVPAIWSDAAKQFMREAAENAGIEPDRLEMSLEPEAASIYCKYIPLCKKENEEDNKEGPGIEALTAGTKYLVLDAGGGTVDITVQEVQGDGSLKQVYMANGGDWGGTRVDDAFEQFLVSLVSREVFDRFKTEHRDAYLDIFREFEIKKRTITPELDHKVTFKIPIAMNELYQEFKGLSLKESARQSTKKMAWIGDKLRVDASEAKNLFNVACEAIVEHVEMIFKQPDAAGTSIILMVGGFSESPMLRHAVKSRFGDTMKIIIPQEAGLSVLKGAVLYGFDTKVISTRVCKETYGIRSSSAFREGVDPEENKKIVKKGVYCRDRFSKHVGIGQKVTLGELTEEHSYFPLEEDQKEIALKVYTSDKTDPEYCERDKCTFIGKLLVDVPTNVPMKDREIVVRLKFGGTEISVESIAKKTGKETSATFNLLG